MATLLLATLTPLAELLADEFTNPGATYSYSTSITSVYGAVGPVTTTVKSHATYQTFSYDLSNVDSACASGPNPAVAYSCAIVFHDSRKCDYTGSSPYYATTTSPWAAPKNIFYTAAVTGGVWKATSLSVTVPTGVPENDLHGKTVVVYSHTGVKIACAVLWDLPILTRLLAIPRVSEPNCNNILKIAAGTEKAKPIDVVGNHHQQAGTLRSIPLLTKENCAKAFPYGAVGSPDYHRG